MTDQPTKTSTRDGGDAAPRIAPTSELRTAFDTALYAFAALGAWSFGAHMWPVVRNPMLTWALITGTPYDFDHAVR